MCESGQVTLSKKIREELGVDMGSYVMFQKEGSRLLMLPAEIRPKGVS